MSAQSIQFPSSEAREPINGPTVHRLTSYDAAKSAAADHMISAGGSIKEVLAFRQGNRIKLTGTLSLSEILRQTRVDPTPKGGNPLDFGQRPEDRPHIMSIANYLVQNEEYTLDSMTLVSDVRLDVWMHSTSGGFLHIPAEYQFDVGNGMHRRGGISKAIAKRAELGYDSIVVEISFEQDEDQRRQDFADLAKTKPISGSLKATYDSRDGLLYHNIRKFSLFQGRIDLMGSKVAKSSDNLFVFQALKDGVNRFLYGSKTPGKTTATTIELTQRASEFFYRFETTNPQYAAMLTTPPESLQMIPLRAEFVHFNSAGFQVLCRVGHDIFKSQDENRRMQLVEAMANLDWTKTSGLFRGNIVQANGNPNTGEGNLSKACLSIKTALGLVQ